jgi:hypothetical protein
VRRIFGRRLFFCPRLRARKKTGRKKTSRNNPPLLKPKTKNTTTKTVVLKPVAQALNRVIRPGVKVVLTLNGETGKSVGQYASSWLALVGESKKRVLANRPRVPPGDVAVGISLNYNRVAGWVDFDAVKPSRELFCFDWGWFFFFSSGGGVGGRGGARVGRVFFSSLVSRPLPQRRPNDPKSPQTSPPKNNPSQPNNTKQSPTTSSTSR